MLVADTGWNIPALNGFPGPFMHYIAEWFTVDDLLNLMKPKDDRTILMENVAVFKDKDGIQIFSSNRLGKILLEAHGEGIPIDQIATFRQDNKTVSECVEGRISHFDENGVNNDSVWTQFGKWYTSYKKE